ncbi:Fanconi anemia group A protein [Channa argus]|uniref:Fanconi anemia group A protein n=1 Tax=Channa argus TaxID=215402 RepID=A0A6G1PGI5_CHAAH|nr:Fanconi anemia group A protein [Channa argus]
MEDELTRRFTFEAYNQSKMSLSASCDSVSQKRTLSSLLGSRVVKRPKQEDGQRLQEAAIQLLDQHQNFSDLLKEVGNPDPGNIFCTQNGEQKQEGFKGIPSDFVGSLLVCNLRRQATQLGVPVVVLSVKMVLERLMEIIGTEDENEDKKRELLTSSQRMLPKLEVVYHLHSYRILTLTYILQGIQIFDASLCGVSTSAEALQRFFTHTLTQTLTYKPRLTVSDAITLQNEWTFAKASWLLTSLFRKLAVIFSVELLLHHLQQVLETREVNWKHVLCFLSTLLVYNPNAQPRLKELLSRLLSSAFESYDLENMITAFLLARQGALEGPGVFPHYSDWFKVHILHPPYVPVKHRSLLMEYVSLAKTRLADLKPQCQAVQDVEKAVSLFESTGRISATVMEASHVQVTDTSVLPQYFPQAIFSDTIPSCPVDAKSEISAQLSRISHTLNIIIPGRPDELIGQTVIKVHIETPMWPELHVKVVNMILRSFSQCVLDASRANPPNKQSQWASRVVTVLLGNRQLLSSLIQRLWDLFHNQASLLSNAHLVGLAVFVVHLHASMSKSLLVELIPSALPNPVPVGEALSSALVCSTHTNMLSCVRLCVAAMCYGICRGNSLPQQQQQEYIPSALYKKLMYLIPRLLPEARRPSIIASDSVFEHVEENLQGLWSSTTDSNSTWRKTAWYLWRHTAFRQLQQMPQYQLLFSEWLAHELRVQRSEDVLSDTERQEYQQWACLELYLTHSEEQGGCGGDMKILCSHLFSAIMDQKLSEQSPKRSDTGTCLPDILSRLQELVYEMEVTELSGRHGGRADLSDFLFELVSQRCPTTESSTSLSVISELNLQHTLTVWNSVRCGYAVEELNKTWSQICLHCPLLVISTVHWWERLSPLMRSQWSRLYDEEPLPQQLQLLTDCQHWASSLGTGRSSSMPPAPPLLLAASLHRAWRDHTEDSQAFSAALNTLRPDRGIQSRQERNNQRARNLFTELLSLVVDCGDWLLIFNSKEHGVYHLVTRVTTDKFTRLMPWAFYNLLLQQSADLLQKAMCCPGFLHTAILCYIKLLQLFLEGETPTTTTESSKEQVEPFRILSHSKQFVLRAISQTSPTALSSGQLRQLESQCADLDPESIAECNEQSKAVLKSWAEQRGLIPNLMVGLT